MKYSFLVFSFLISFSFSFSEVFAQGSGLIVSPQRVLIEGNQRTEELVLANRGTEKARYRISIVNRKMTSDGQLEPTDEPAAGESFAGPHIRYSPRQVTLEGRTSQKVRIMSRLSGNSPDGEYRSHLLIQEIPSAKKAESANQKVEDGEVGFDVNSIFGISLPVILRRGNLEAEASISNPAVARESGNHYVTFVLGRSGQKSLFGTARVFAGDEEIGVIRNVAAYLSIPSRTISVPIEKEHVGRLVGLPLRIVFGPEGDKAGDYEPATTTFTP